MTWISTDTLPPLVEDDRSAVVLVWPRSQGGCIYQRTGLYNYRYRRWESGDSGYILDLPVTHWMSLPDGPEDLSEP